MASTNFAWTTPVENSNPWYTAFIDLINEIDVQLYNWSLDAAYNRGSTITVDTAAISMTVPNTSNNQVLKLIQNDTTNNPAVLEITNTGTGVDITTVTDQDLLITPNGTGVVQFGTDIILGTGKAVQTSKLAGNTLLLQAYDVDGAAYATFATLTANNTPTMVLASAVTGTTQSPGDNSTSLATTAYVDAAVATVDTFLELTDTPGSYTTNGAIYVADNSGGQIDESTVILTESTNTFAITKGTASLDIAAGSTLNVDANLTVSTACTLDQDLQQSASVAFANLTFSTGGALRTSTSAGNTLLLQAYDVDGTAYTTFATLTANNTPTMALTSAVTGVTQSLGDSSTALATTAYVDNTTLTAPRTAVAAATYTALAADFIIGVTYTTTASVIITLPTSQVIAGRRYTIVDEGGNAGTNYITIDTQGSETISGLSEFVINNDYNSISVYSDGTNWFIC